MRRATWTTGLTVFLLTAVSIFVKVTYGQGGPEQPPLRLDALVPELRARIQLAQGLPVLHLSGSPREMGRQHGAILGDRIRHLLRVYIRGFAFTVVSEKNCREWARVAESHIAEHHLEEIRGLAEGADISYDDALLINTVVDLLQSVFCSTVTASGDAAKNGEPIFGRNLDFPGRGMLHKATVVLVWHREGAPDLVSVTWPGLIGVLSGMNDRGVVGATMMIHQFLDEPTPGTPYMLLYRQALEQAGSIADVTRAIESGARTCPNNFMTMDATGASAVIEWDTDKIAVRQPENGCLCSTNYFRSDVLKDVGTPLGLNRYDDLSEFLTRSHGRIGVDEIKAVLRKVARPWYVNVQSMVFLPRQKTVHVAVAQRLPAASQPYVELDAATLFGFETP
ncbi:MAG: C45 family peptidase [Planctomycetota bacterium]